MRIQNSVFMVASLMLLSLVSCSTEIPQSPIVQNTATPAPTKTTRPTPEPTATRTEASTPGTVADADGNIYAVIQLGEQWWMAENLNVTSDPDGRPINGYCYDNDEANCEIYGRLYTWDVAMNGANRESAAGICPTGWHIPSDAEWQELADHLGGEAVAGGKLKEASNLYWASPNTDATNESQLNVLPAGFFDFTGEFMGLGEICFYRTSSAQDAYEVYARELSANSATLRQAGLHPDDAIPIRCIKD